MLSHFHITEQDLYDQLGYKPEVQFPDGLNNEKNNFSPNENPYEFEPLEPDVIRIIQSSIQLAERFNTRDNPRLARLTDLFGALLNRLSHWAKNCDSGIWLKLPTTSLNTWVPQIVWFSYRMENV